MGRAPSEARVRPRLAGSEERKAITEALLDYLLCFSNESEVQECRSCPSFSRVNLGTIVAGAGTGALRENVRREKVLDTSEFLAQMQGDAKAFASARLAAPLHETIEDARLTVINAAKRLRGTSVARETSELVLEQHRVRGDWETEVQVATQAYELARQRLMGK